MSATASRDPYARLLELAERELQCAGEGRYAELAPIAAERATIIEALPATAPEGARRTIERAALMQERATIELHRAREQTLLGLRRVQLARRTARGYRRSVAGGGAAARVDMTA